MILKNLAQLECLSFSVTQQVFVQVKPSFLILTWEETCELNYLNLCRFKPIKEIEGQNFDRTSKFDSNSNKERPITVGAFESSHCPGNEFFLGSNARHKTDSRLAFGFTLELVLNTRKMSIEIST